MLSFYPSAISHLWQIRSKVHFQVLRPKKNQEYWPTDMRRFVCDKSANGLANNCTDAGSFIHCPEDSHVTITIPGPEVRRRPRRTSALSDKHQTFKPIHRVSITYESYIILHCMIKQIISVSLQQPLVVSTLSLFSLRATIHTKTHKYLPFLWDSKPLIQISFHQTCWTAT